MVNSIISIILSIIAAYIYDLIKKISASKKDNTHTGYIKCSKSYIRSVKTEFYLGFFLGITFMAVPDTRHLFFDLSLDILGYFSFFIALMGFMCLADIVKHMSDKAASDNANSKTNT